MTVLNAYLHKVKETGNLHVKVQQPMALSDEFTADMHRCGSPATWTFSKMEWDFPLTAACVLTLQRVAEKHRCQIQWSQDLQQYAAEQRQIDDYEQKIRMAMENIISKNEYLPGYVTNTQKGAPMRHQMVAFHWGLRFTGLFLAWDPGTGKTRAGVDLSRGWYDIGVVRPMQQFWNAAAGCWAVRGGILVITKASMVRTWANEYQQWQGMTAMEIAGVKDRKMYKSALPTHAHVVNFESLKNVLHNEYDGLVIDECFPPKTPIQTPSGAIDIDKLSVGDTVLAFNHYNQSIVSKRITHVFRNKRRASLCTIRTTKGSITCTANHPVWTARGYIPAASVVVGDVLARSGTDTLRGVWEPKSEEKRREGVLSPQGMLLKTVPGYDSRQDTCSVEQDTCLGPYEGQQSHEKAGGTGESIKNTQGNEARSSHARRQRQADMLRVDTMRRVELCASWVVHEAGSQDGQKVQLAEWSETGSVKPVVEGGCGVERSIPPSHCSERAGWPEDTVFEGVRVVSVDLHEQTGEGRIVDGRTDDTDIVFNLEVEEHHNYIASNFLVHNCHSCANSSGFTENTLKLAQHTRRRLALTGTPISNNLESAFYQMLIVDGGRALGPGKTKFLDEYFVPSDKGAQGHTKNLPKPGALESVSNKMARCTYFLKKEDVLDLPPKTHTPLYLDMTPDQARYYNKLKDDYLVYIQDSQVSAQQAAARMMKLRQMCQGFVYDDSGVAKDFNAAKVEALVDMLKTKFTGRKVVVWAVFTHEINMLCQRLMQEQIGFVRLDGTVTSKKVRDSNLKLWNENPAAQVFIGQIQMGVGITLHANECYVPCYDCVYLGIDYSFINWTQSQDRIHRIGQKYPCSYTYLLTDDGVDRNIYQSLQSKANTSNAVYKAGKEFYASLVKGDEPNLAAIDVAA